MDIQESQDLEEIDAALEHLGPLSDEEKRRWREELHRIAREYRELQEQLEHLVEPDWGKLAEELEPLRNSLRKIADILDGLGYGVAFQAAGALSSATILAPLNVDESKEFIDDKDIEFIGDELIDFSHNLRFASDLMANPREAGRPEKNLDKNRLALECFIVFGHCRPEIWGWCRPDRYKDYGEDLVRSAHLDLVSFVESIYMTASGQRIWRISPGR